MNMKVFTSTNQRMMVWGKSMLNQFPFEFLFACSSQIILEGDGLSCCVMDTSSRKNKCHIDSPFGCADKGCISIPSDQVPIPKQIWQWLKNWHAKGATNVHQSRSISGGLTYFSAISYSFQPGFFKLPNCQATKRCQWVDSTEATAIKESCSNGRLTQAEFDRRTVRCILDPNSFKQA